MDRAILQQRLEEAESDVERTQRNIASQHQMIATLENGGHDACAYQLSHPDIFVMESAEEWDCCE